MFLKRDSGRQVGCELYNLDKWFGNVFIAKEFTPQTWCFFSGLLEENYLVNHWTRTKLLTF